MYCNNIANRYYRRPELLATFLLLLVLKISNVSSVKCQYYPTNSNNSGITYYADCDTCCGGIHSSPSDTCCSSQFVSSQLLWALPFLIIIIVCTLLSIASAFYMFYLKNRERRRIASGVNATSQSAQSIAAALSMINIGRDATRTTINPDIKPHRVDTLPLPSYKEAARMQSTEAPTPPAYRNLYLDELNNDETKY